MINRKSLYKELRANAKLPKLTKLSQQQVDGIEAILDKWESDTCRFIDCRWLAYMLATVYHECDGKMYPIEEYGKGKGRPYGRKLKYSRQSYTTPNKIYYGRGLVQLTWYENYEKFGKILGLDLLNHPEISLQLKESVDIMFEGMLRGLYTGVGLPKYFSATVDDPINARRIINGTDKSSLIKGYHDAFMTCIEKS